MDAQILEELQVTRQETIRLLAQIRNWISYVCYVLTAAFVAAVIYVTGGGWLS